MLTVKLVTGALLILTIGFVGGVFVERNVAEGGAVECRAKHR
jgi:hypothetical protein